MSSRLTEGGGEPGRRARLVNGSNPLLVGLMVAAVLVLTLLATAVLAMQDQALVALTEPAGINTMVLPSSSPTQFPAVALPSRRPTSTQAPTATASPIWQPSLSPTASPSPSASPDPSPSQTPSPSPSPTPQPTETRRPLASSAQNCNPPATWREYTVKRRDTLKELAARFGTSVSRLKRGNCLRSNTIRAGTVLWVPSAQPTSVPQTEPTPLPNPKPTLRPTHIPPRIPKPAPHGGAKVVPPQLGAEPSLPAFSLSSVSENLPGGNHDRSRAPRQTTQS
jgi:LysM repeat protein